MNKRCLFIDDDADEVESVLENLKEKGKAKGLLIDCELFSLSNKFYNKNNDFDIDEIKLKLDEKLDEIKYDLVACDFNLEDDKITGIDIVNIVRNKNRNCTIIIYSGNLDKIVSYILKQENNNKIFKKIKTIIRCKVADFIDRNQNYEDEIINLLKNSIPLEVLIEKKLLDFPGLTFRHGYKIFIGKTLKEIAHEINSDSYHGVRFKKEIIERGICHMIDLNNEYE